MIDKTMLYNPQQGSFRMRRRLVLVGKGLAFLLGLLLVAGGEWALLPPATRPIPGEYAMAELQSISISGFPQTVLLRGNDRRNPILLYVHGGPGASQMPIARTYSDELEKHFVVVHWDQRGAGASCAGVDWNTLSLDQNVNDTIELAEKLGQGRKSLSLGTRGAAWLVHGPYNAARTSFMPLSVPDNSSIVTVRSRFPMIGSLLRLKGLVTRRR